MQSHAGPGAAMTEAVCIGAATGPSYIVARTAMHIGRPSFSVLQNHLSDKPRLHLFAFDLLVLRGKDLIQEPLEKRRELLRRKVIPRLVESIRYSETLDGSAREVVEAVSEQGLEGVVAKRRYSRYAVGRLI